MSVDKDHFDTLSDILSDAKNYYLYGNDKLYRVGHKCGTSSLTAQNSAIPCNVMSGSYHAGLADASWSRFDNPLLKNNGTGWDYNENSGVFYCLSGSTQINSTDGKCPKGYETGIFRQGRHTDGSIYTSQGVTFGTQEAPSSAGTFFINKLDKKIIIPNRYIGRPLDVSDSDPKFNNIKTVSHTSSSEAFSVAINKASGYGVAALPDSPLINEHGAMDITVHMAKGSLMVQQWDKTVTPSAIMAYGKPCDEQTPCFDYTIECDICKARADKARQAEENREIFCKNTFGHVWGSVPCDNFNTGTAYSDCLNECINGTGPCADQEYSSIGGRPPDLLHDCGCGRVGSCNFELLLNAN